MKRVYIPIILTILCIVSANSSHASSIAYLKKVVLSTPVNVVYLNLNDSNVKVTPAISERGRGSSESVQSFISRTRPTFALSGTFFDTRSLLPTGDIVIGGVMVHSGCLGTALCISPDNRAFIIPHKYRASRIAAGYETVIAGGLTLAQNGQIALNPRAEGFRDPAVYRPGKRTAVGVTSANKLIFVTIGKSVSLRQTARIMLRLGASDAMLLDGGSSSAMYVNGRYVTRPGRRLTNLVLAYTNADSFLQARASLAPTLLTPDKMVQPLLEPLPAAELWKTRVACHISVSDSFPAIANITGFKTGDLLAQLHTNDYSSWPLVIASDNRY